MSNQTVVTEKSGKFTGWHMAIIMVAFFAVIVAVNGYMAYVAVNSWTGLTARNGYVASQDFNANLAVQRKQDALGYQSLLRYSDGAMVFSLRDRSGEALAGFDVSVKVGRPTHEGEDREIILEETSPGIYRQELKLAPGQWNVDVVANDNAGHPYKRLIRVYVNK